MVGPKKTKLRTFYGSPSSRFGAVNCKPMAIALLSKFKVSFSVECVSWYWVGRSDWKKNPKKQNHQKSRNRRPWYPRTTLKVNIQIFGLTKHTIYCKKCLCLCSCFLYAVTMLIFQIKRIISSEKWFNYVVTLFLKMPKIWVGRTTLNGEKRRMACLLTTTALPGKFNIFVRQLSSTPIKNALLG